MNNQVKEAYLDREIPYLNANWKYPTMINFWLSIREGFFLSTWEVFLKEKVALLIHSLSRAGCTRSNSSWLQATL